MKVCYLCKGLGKIEKSRREEEIRFLIEITKAVGKLKKDSEIWVYISKRLREIGKGESE